jgi:parallel beta-helix repeat protein
MNPCICIINKRLVVFSIAAASSLFAACSEEEGVAPPGENQPPEIAFTVTQIAVPKNSSFTLTADVTDPDGDAVTVNWTVTRGGQPSGFLGQQGNPSILWSTPATVGVDTVTIEASDGKGATATLFETILVGTLKNNPVQTANQTWESTDSPFIIRPLQDKFVIEGVTLTIEAGSELLIDREDLEINVKGELRVNGTLQAPVVIRPNLRAPEPGRWFGIVAEPEGVIPPRIEMNHTNILHAAEAVKAAIGGKIFLDGCRVMFSSQAAVLHESLDSLSVQNSIITNNVTSGIRILRLPGLQLPPMIEIRNDSIAFNGDLTGGTPYTDQAAIYIDIPDPDGVVPIEIHQNQISRNGFPGIQLVNASYPVINSNSIFFNELGKSGVRYNIRLDDDFGGSIGTIDARSNFWGGAFTNPAVDSLTIKAGIRDGEDDPSITVNVLIYPWLNASP